MIKNLNKLSKLFTIIIFININLCSIPQTKTKIFLPYSDEKKLYVGKVYTANVMSLPDENSQVITRINRSDKINILGKSEDKYTIFRRSDYWYKIEVNDLVGYIFGEFLEEEEKETAEKQECKVEFPKNFDYGELSVGPDCENIKFNKNKTFIYHFTGDCKGWGRYLKGKWQKKEGYLILSAILTEGFRKDENEYCSGSYYETFTPNQKKECTKKYKERILKKYKKYPTKFQVNGKLSINQENYIILDLDSYWINNRKINGFLKINNEAFKSFDTCEGGS